MKFVTRMYNQKRITEQGVITDILIKLRNEDKTVRKLTENELMQVPNIYGSLDPTMDILNIDNKDKCNTDAGTITGADLKALTAIIYEYPRTAYVDCGKKPQYMVPLASSACPLALLGWKRKQNIPYNSWRLDKDLFHIEEGKIKLADENALKQLFKLDLYLGKGLASTGLSGGTLSLRKGHGLGMLSPITDIEYLRKDIRYFREQGTYRNQNFASTYGATKVEENGRDITVLYNSCNALLKLMIAQRWVYYGLHRASDLICDFRDWDNIPPSIDDTGPSIKSEKQTTIADMFGLDLTPKEDTASDIFGIFKDHESDDVKI